MPFLKEAENKEKKNLPGDFNGQRLVCGNTHIICQNNSYELRDNQSEKVIKTIPIKQNEDGVDTQDRIVVLKRFVKRMEEQISV